MANSGVARSSSLPLLVLPSPPTIAALRLSQTFKHLTFTTGRMSYGTRIIGVSLTPPSTAQRSRKKETWSSSRSPSFLPSFLVPFRLPTPLVSSTSRSYAGHVPFNSLLPFLLLRASSLHREGRKRCLALPVRPLLPRSLSFLLAEPPSLLKRHPSLR